MKFESGSAKYFALRRLHFAREGVNYSDEISNCQFIIDFANVVDFIGEMAVFSRSIKVRFNIQ
jgi:hypothetical protein